jgi:hypothetical protein
MLGQLLDVIRRGQTAQHDAPRLQVDGQVADAAAGPQRDLPFQLLL